MPREKVIRYSQSTGMPGLDSPLVPARKLGLPDRVTVYRELNKGEYLCLVPVGLIESGGVPIDKFYLAEVKQRIASDSEQQSDPGLIAQVKESGESKLYLCKGFHQCEARRDDISGVFLSVVKLNCTKNEVIDLRMRHATHHRPVTFGRVVKWARESWDLTLWSENISLLKAVSKLQNSVVDWEKEGLSKKEAKDIKKWVDSKCMVWNRTRKSLYNYLSIAGRLDPRLIEKTSVSRIRNLSYEQRRAIAEVLPGKYDLQMIAADRAERDGFSYRRTKKFAHRLLSRSQDKKSKSESKPEKKKKKKTKDVLAWLSDAINKLKTANIRLSSEVTTLSEREAMLKQPWFSFSDFSSDDNVLSLADELFYLEVENLIMLTRPKISAARRSALEYKHSVGVDRKTKVIFTSDSTVRDLSDDSNGFTLLKEKARELISKAKHENDWTGIHELFNDRLYKFILYRVGFNQVAEDLLHDVWIKVMERIGSFEYRDGMGDKDTSLEPWIFKIVRNTVIDYYRIEGNKVKKMDPIESADLQSTVFGHPGTPFSYEESSLLHEAIILALNPLQRKVIIMYYWLGISTKEIAGFLRKGEGAIRALRMRGIQAIKREWNIEDFV